MSGHFGVRLPVRTTSVGWNYDNCGNNLYIKRGSADYLEKNFSITFDEHFYKYFSKCALFRKIFSMWEHFRREWVKSRDS